MSESFTYEFESGSTQIVLVVGVSTPATNSTGHGLGYAVTSIGGVFGSGLITGEVGVGGTNQSDAAEGYGFDNTVFVGSSGGFLGSTDGIDYSGLEFTYANNQYNLYSAGGIFYLFEDGVNVYNGTPITLEATNYSPACFCLGTLILTDCGEVSVEALAVGDMVVTASGEHCPIRWIGRRSYAGRFLGSNPAARPILFRAGSLGHGLPRRDLRVSPKHAMFLDGVLVPAEDLMNGTTIVRDHICQRVDYYHIELDRHSVLLAEGAPSESFVDDDSRFMFHNAGEWAVLYPGHTPVPAVFCAPRVEGGFALDSIRRRLSTPANGGALAA